MSSKPVVADRVEIAQETIDRARKGDERAWTVLVNTLGPTIRGFARAKGVPDPDDLTQEVFVAVAKSFATFEGEPEAFRSWVFAIAYRRIVDRWRRKDRDPAPLTADLADSGAPTPEAAAVLDSTARDALDATEVLTAIERDVVLLRVLTGMETKEVARVVGKRPGNIRVIQSRALKKLRTELERRGYGTESDPRAGR